MERPLFLQAIRKAFEVHPIVALLGPRQCGKTTLARTYASDAPHFSKSQYFDLEDDQAIQRLEHPKLALQPLEGLIIIDEIQKRPELFPMLRVLVDERPLRHRFLILGSASRQLIRQSSETLAGRIEYIELTPFNSPEAKDVSLHWLRGGFPLSFLAESNETSYQWRQAYIRTYLEQDIPNLVDISVPNIRRFWMMLSHYHGQILNVSEISASLNIAHKTCKHYLDVLAATFMVRQLNPWYENIKKRQIKSPKIYFRDSGILHSLLGIREMDELLIHPKLGASWEGMALEEIIRKHQADNESCYFWGVHQQAELDLLLVQNGERLGFEFKYSDAPKLTRSMQMAMTELKLDQLTVIYPGSISYPLAERVTVVPLKEYLEASLKGGV